MVDFVDHFCDLWGIARPAVNEVKLPIRRAPALPVLPHGDESPESELVRLALRNLLEPVHLARAEHLDDPLRQLGTAAAVHHQGALLLAARNGHYEVIK